MNKKLLMAVFVLLVSTNANYAQQIFKISQFTQHNFLFNPAAAGANSEASIGATYRKMWSGMPGGPQTTLLYGDKYFSKMKAGLGVVLYADKTGPTSRTGGQINLSYSVVMPNAARLMFGVAGNVLQYRIDKESFAHYIPNDPLLSSSGNEIKGDAAAGIYYSSPTLNLGASVQQLVQAKLNFVKSSTNPDGRLYRHYYFMGSYNWHTDESNVLIPNFMVKYLPNAPVDFEAGARLEHKDLIWVGFNWHYKQNYTAFAGIKAGQQLAIGYALDVYKTPLSNFDNGGLAHEFTLRFFFKK
jgi:type IX secretion system PorP/SprF family membrane protein